MTNAKPPTLSRKTAQVVVGLNVLMLLAGIVLSVRFSVQTLLEAWSAVVTIQVVGSIVYSVLAVLILSQHPRHNVGWLFLVVSFFFALTTLVGGLLALAVNGPRPSPAARDLLASFGALTWSLPYFIPVTLVLQFFPNGRLPSPRWRPLTAATVIALLLSFATFNPFALPGSEDPFPFLRDFSGGIMSIAVVGSLAAVAVRFLRSRGSERTQMKWLVYTAAVGISLLFLLGLLSNPDSRATSVLFISLPMLLALAISVAILRHQLFDIDLIIRRTVQYGILTTVLALFYYAGVLLLRAILTSLTGAGDSPLVIVITTLAVAALFNPLRLRVQGWIDRRFYREKYDARQALAAFAATARDEVDLDELTAALVGVVVKTVQPEHVSLWLASRDTDWQS